jgi:hypothetical protein
MVIPSVEEQAVARQLVGKHYLRVVRMVEASDIWTARLPGLVVKHPESGNE